MGIIIRIIAGSLILGAFWLGGCGPRPGEENIDCSSLTAKADCAEESDCGWVDFDPLDPENSGYCQDKPETTGDDDDDDDTAGDDDDDDNDDNDTVAGCRDSDGDLHDGYDATECPDGDDSCDDDAANWSEAGCANCVDADKDGYFVECDSYDALLGPDCDDTRNSVNPGAEEIAYNERDNDCNPETPYDDLDGDGFISTEECNDNNPDINPGMEEIPYNYVDDDCDSQTRDMDRDGDGHDRDFDCDDLDSGIWDLKSGYADADQDGYGIGALVDVCSGNSLPSGYAGFDGDCDDTDSTTWQIKSGHPDGDGDTYPAIDAVDVCSGTTLPFGYFNTGSDCDDSDRTSWQMLSGYVDADGDGYGDQAASLIDVCAGSGLPAGYTDTNTDCDDTDAIVWTMGQAYLDVDGDGYGAGAPLDACVGDLPPDGYSFIDGDCVFNSPAHWNDCGLCVDSDGDDYGPDCNLGDDCDPNDPLINPEAVEIDGTGIDEDCDGIADETDRFEQLFLPPTPEEIAAVDQNIVRPTSLGSCRIGDLIPESGTLINPLVITYDEPGSPYSITAELEARYISYESEGNLIWGVHIRATKTKVVIYGFPLELPMGEKPTVFYNHPTGDISSDQVAAMITLATSPLVFMSTIPSGIPPDLPFYTVVGSAWRGWKVVDDQHLSEGTADFYDGEVTDQVNLIECARQLNAAGQGGFGLDSFATFGISYGGGMSIHTAVQQPPGLACVVDDVGPTNLFDNYFKVAAWDVLSGGPPPIDNPIYSVLLDGWNNGTISTAEARRGMLLRSGLYFAERITAPVQIHHGTADELVPYQNSVDLANRLKDLGKPYEFKSYLGLNHVDGGTEGATNSLEYLNQCLYPQ